MLTSTPTTSKADSIRMPQCPSLSKAAVLGLKVNPSQMTHTVARFVGDNVPSLQGDIRVKAVGT